jgi:GWxTD domain-containing protein
VTPAINALGWSLLHLLWEGAAVALILALTLGVARSAKVRYGLACAALTLTLAAFIGTLVVLIERNPGFGAPFLPPPHFPALSSAVPGAAPTPVSAFDPTVWIVPVWFSGVMVFYLRAIGGWLSARRWRTRGVCAAGEFWQSKLAELTHRVGFNRTVVLLQSSLAEVPVVIGYLRPVILLPLGMLSCLSTEQVEYILLHELAHIRRHDYLVNLLQTLAEGILFYHPAVWWISGIIRAERENCCDDEVAARGNARDYAAALTTLEEYRQGAREPAMAATGGNLMKRIRRLLMQPERPRAALTPIFSALLVLITAGISIAYQSKQPDPVKQASPAITTPPMHSPQSRSKPVTLLAQARGGANERLETAWQKWLNEDVAYIITDEERAAYKALTTDEEREMFVNQFWERRDPTPGTAPNEFKTEHYRRVGYTNQRFGVQSFPGWKTDRGRIYISYGPPDEIDSHPAGDGTNYPFEQWRYRYIQGIGNDVIIEFIDPNADGTFRMTMDPHEKERLQK